MRHNRNLSLPVITSVKLNFSQDNGSIKDLVIKVAEQHTYEEPPVITSLQERLSYGLIGSRVEHDMSLEKSS